MKKLGTLLSVLFILYIIYYDVRIGTLPIANGETIKKEEEVATQSQTSHIPSETIKVKAGDTVLSIVESVNKEYRISSIETVIKDFEALNPNVEAEVFQIGRT